MATTAHHIYSTYSEEDDRAHLEVETGQFNADADIEDPWLTVNTFGVSKRIGNPPRFVPAVLDYGDWESKAGPSDLTKQKREALPEERNVSSWYRSLTRKTPTGSVDTSVNASKASTPPPPPSQPSLPAKRIGIKRDRNNWFISRVLESDVERPLPASAPPATLADILSREPPPEPSEVPFSPPVFLAIGPGNKGFQMLQKTGWEEGDPLGRYAPRRGLGFRPSSAPPSTGNLSQTLLVRGGENLIPDISKEVIDLTLSDDDEVEEIDELPGQIGLMLQSPVKAESQDSIGLDHNPRSLITPLPTILKSDRLGIGLKAKTAGPYRESLKKVTPSQKALAAHVKANEELRRLKKEVGRGRRGFERLKKKEERDRRTLLSYMNE